MATKDELSAAAESAEPPFHEAMTLPEGDPRVDRVADAITQIADTHDVIVSFQVRELPSVAAAEAIAKKCKACACGCLCLL